LKFLHLLTNGPKRCNRICSNGCILCLGETVIASAEHKNEDIKSSNTNQHPLYSDHIVLQTLSRLSQAIRYQKNMEYKKTKSSLDILMRNQALPIAKIAKVSFFVLLSVSNRLILVHFKTMSSNSE
jgi:hypothetical protein